MLALCKSVELLALGLVSSSSIPETARRIRVAPILIACAVGFVAGEVIASVLIAAVSSLSHFPGGFTALAKAVRPPWWSIVLGLVGLWVGFLGAIYVATVHGHLSPLAHQWRPTWRDLWFVPLGVACQYGIDLVYYPFHLKHLNKPITHLFGGAHGATFVLVVVLSTFVAPIVEEWFFRGVLYRTLNEGFRGAGNAVGATLAVGLSAILFALAHGEPLQFAGLALFGVVLALVLRRTQRLVPSIVTHASFNAVAMVSVVAHRLGH